MRACLVALFGLVLVGCPEPSTPTSSSSSSGSASGSSSGSSSGSTSGSGGTDATDTKTIFVSETKADCEGEGPMKCLQIRETADGPWTLLYAPIEGFTYEEGTKYELKVKVEHVGDPPADSSSKKYKLVEIVSQQKTAK